MNDINTLKCTNDLNLINKKLSRHLSESEMNIFSPIKLNYKKKEELYSKVDDMQNEIKYTLDSLKHVGNLKFKILKKKEKLVEKLNISDVKNEKNKFLCKNYLKYYLLSNSKELNLDKKSFLILKRFGDYKSLLSLLLKYGSEKFKHIIDQVVKLEVNIKEKKELNNNLPGFGYKVDFNVKNFNLEDEIKKVESLNYSESIADLKDEFLNSYLIDSINQIKNNVNVNLTNSYSSSFLSGKKNNKGNFSVKKINEIKKKLFEFKKDKSIPNKIKNLSSKSLKSFKNLNNSNKSINHSKSFRNSQSSLKFSLNSPLKTKQITDKKIKKLTQLKSLVLKFDNNSKDYNMNNHPFMKSSKSGNNKFQIKNNDKINDCKFNLNEEYFNTLESIRPITSISIESLNKNSYSVKSKDLISYDFNTCKSDSNINKKSDFSSELKNEDTKFNIIINNNSKGGSRKKTVCFSPICFNKNTSIKSSENENYDKESNNSIKIMEKSKHKANHSFSNKYESNNSLNTYTDFNKSENFNYKMNSFNRIEYDIKKEKNNDDFILNQYDIKTNEIYDDTFLKESNSKYLFNMDDFNKKVKKVNQKSKLFSNLINYEKQNLSNVKNKVKELNVKLKDKFINLIPKAKKTPYLTIKNSDINNYISLSHKSESKYISVVKAENNLKKINNSSVLKFTKSIIENLKLKKEKTYDFKSSLLNIKQIDDNYKKTFQINRNINSSKDRAYNILN